MSNAASQPSLRGQRGGLDVIVGLSYGDGVPAVFVDNDPEITDTTNVFELDQMFRVELNGRQLNGNPPARSDPADDPDALILSGHGLTVTVGATDDFMITVRIVTGDEFPATSYGPICRVHFDDRELYATYYDDAVAR